MLKAPAVEILLQVTRPNRRLWIYDENNCIQWNLLDSVGQDVSVCLGGHE
jgi:hypothetical protein